MPPKGGVFIMLFTIFNKNFKNYIFFAASLLFSAVIIIGCSSETTNPPTVIDNPNVKTFDSVGVDEDVALTSYSGINLANGTTVTTVDASRDVSLADSGSAGINFFLRTGVLDNLLPGGYDTRFFLVKS